MCQASHSSLVPHVPTSTRESGASKGVSYWPETHRGRPCADWKRSLMAASHSWSGALLVESTEVVYDGASLLSVAS